jgi:predicted nucleic acid-binding protein
MERRALVLDANILIRAVLGQRVRRILEAHADNISFFIPEIAYAEAEEHLATLVAKHGGDPAKALAFLRSIAALAYSRRPGCLWRFRNRSAEAAWCARSGGLADSRSRPCSRLSDLD